MPDKRMVTISDSGDLDCLGAAGVDLDHYEFYYKLVDGLKPIQYAVVERREKAKNPNCCQIKIIILDLP